MDAQPQPPPPKEPMCLRLSNLYGSCDKKIQSFITEHCSHCSSFYESNLHSSSSQCEEQLCVYIYWHYRHYWLKHKRVEPTEACSGCDSCLKLHRWISLHAPECLKQLSHCCLSLCQQMKQSQHLSNLGKADHNFMSQIESRSHLATSPQPPNSLPGVTHQFYNGDLPHSVAGDRTLLSQYQRGNTPTHSMLPQKLINSPGHTNRTPLMEEQRSLQHSNSSASLSQARRQMPASSHHHCQSNSNLQAQQSNYCNSDPSTLMMREADSNAQYNPPDLSAQHQQQWVAPSDLSPHSIHVMSSTRHNGALSKAVIQTQYSTSMANGDCYAVNGVRTHAMGYDAMQTSSNQLATPTGDLKLSRQCSNTSSGYGTASSTGTGRHSVISILSRDQSLSEIVDPENALQVGSTPHRKASAPGPNFNSKAKKMLNQQSQSLTDLAQNIPEYPYDHEEKECNEDKECNGHSSLQRQDTGHSTKVVFAGLGDSVSGEHYKSVMGSKRKMPKQAAVEEAVESSPSPPVTKRPLQREQSDVSGKDKIVLGGGDGRCGSNSLTRDQYDSIFKFQEQRGILSDQQTREKVLGKQHKQAVVAEKHLRRGTMNSDVVSDFDTESSTSDIQGSSPLTSSDFSELDQDLTDQEEDKKVAQTESKMTVEEQIQMIQAMKAGKMSLPVNMANPELHHDRARTKKQHFNHAMPSPSLPPEMMSTYTPSSHPLHSLPQGTRHTTLTPRNSSSTISDGASTLESERFSNNTLKEEENCYGSNRVSIGSCGPATHSSTDGSTLTGGSFEGRFTSLRLSSNTSSERNEDALGMVNSPAPSSLPVLQSSLACHMQRQLSASSPMDMSQSDAERNSYYGMQSEEVQSMESDIRGSLSPAQPPFQPVRYKLASSQVQQMCQRVDDVKEKYHHELLRIRHKGQLMHQGAPDISDEEQQRKIPGFLFHVDKHYDSNTMYRGTFTRDRPESSFPELERRYYNETLHQQFPEKDEEIAKDIERRHLLKEYLLGKFHSGNAYREGVHWHRKTQLGKGGQAECYSIQDVTTQMIMALKEEKEDAKTLDEAFVCMKLSYLSNASQNIVDYYCAALLPKEYNLRRMSQIQVFMEMVPACLHAYLHDNGPFRNEDLHHFGYQLFDALDYLHSTLRIIHCDIKPANLLLDYTAQRLKLTDFGFAQILDQYSSEVQSDENAGTLSYNPPEHYSEKRCSFALDIWQAGCTLLTMATGRRPWRHLFMDIIRKQHPPAFVQAVRRGQANMIGQQTGGHMYPAFLDDSLKKLLHGCLCRNPQSRLSAQDCVYQLAMAETPHMNEQHKTKIHNAFGYWRSPPPVLGTYQQDAHFVDIYLDTTRHAVVDGTHYNLCHGWLGCVPYQDGITFGQLEKEILPQYFPVIQHLSSFSLCCCENSPQALFMKANEHTVELTFEPATPQSLVDRTKAVVLSIV